MSDSHMESSVVWVEVDKIVPNPYQPRREFVDATLTELSDSIRQYGVLQPLVVSRASGMTTDGPETRYELVAGERRLRASKLAGLERVPAIIRSGDSGKQKLELAIIENLQREDLNAVDRAKAFLQLAQEFGLSHTEIGKRMGKSREYVSNSLRLLALPQEILDALAVKKISEGHTRPLLMLSHKPEDQKLLFHDIMNYKMSVRAAEARARKSAQEKVRKDYLKIDPTLLNLEQKLSESLGARVAIETAKDGNGGRLVINYFNPDELGELIKLVGQASGDPTLLQQGLAQKALGIESSEQPGSEFKLKTGFLDDVSVDDDPGEMLSSESEDKPIQKQFGFNEPVASVPPVPKKTVVDTPVMVTDSQPDTEEVSGVVPPHEPTLAEMLQTAQHVDSDDVVMPGDTLASIPDLQTAEMTGDISMRPDATDTFDSTSIDDADLDRALHMASDTIEDDLYESLFKI